jgi:cobalamin synthase
MAILATAAAEFRRLLADEGGFSFIDWAITISLVSMIVGFFIPDLWALFDEVIGGVTGDVAGINRKMKLN